MKMTISSRRAGWAFRLLVPLSAALMAVAVAPVHSAAIRVGDEAPQPSYALPTKPSELLRASAGVWKPLLAQVSAALDERAKAADLLSKPALIELQIQRAVLSQMERSWPVVLDAVKKARQLQDSEQGRQTAGLLNEALARQAVSGEDAAWLQRHLRDQVLAMPWAEVEATIRELRQQLALMKSDVIETYVVNRLDLSASITHNKVNLGFVTQLLAMRFQLLEVMPRREALVAGLDEAIALRSAAAASASGK